MGRAEWRSLDFGECELMRKQPALLCPELCCSSQPRLRGSWVLSDFQGFGDEVVTKRVMSEGV